MRKINLKARKKRNFTVGLEMDDIKRLYRIAQKEGHNSVGRLINQAVTEFLENYEKEKGTLK